MKIKSIIIISLTLVGITACASVCARAIESKFPIGFYEIGFAFIPNLNNTPEEETERYEAEKAEWLKSNNN